MRLGLLEFLSERVGFRDCRLYGVEELFLFHGQPLGALQLATITDDLVSQEGFRLCFFAVLEFRQRCVADFRGEELIVINRPDFAAQNCAHLWDIPFPSHEEPS